MAYPFVIKVEQERAKGHPSGPPGCPPYSSLLCVTAALPPPPGDQGQLSPEKDGSTSCLLVPWHRESSVQEAVAAYN